MKQLVLSSFVLPYVLAFASSGCGDAPTTYAVIDNRYPTSVPAANAQVVYMAQWQSLIFADPIAPGASSEAQKALPASDNTAYAVLAPGLDTDGGGDAGPTSIVVLQSRAGYDLHANNTLHIAIDDTTFAGNCAAGSTLTQSQADFITERVFDGAFANLRYDAATCTTTLIGDAGAP